MGRLPNGSAWTWFEQKALTYGHHVRLKNSFVYICGRYSYWISCFPKIPTIRFIVNATQCPMPAPPGGSRSFDRNAIPFSLNSSVYSVAAHLFGQFSFSRKFRGVLDGFATRICDSSRTRIFLLAATRWRATSHITFNDKSTAVCKLSIAQSCLFIQFFHFGHFFLPEAYGVCSNQPHTRKFRYSHNVPKSNENKWSRIWTIQCHRIYYFIKCIVLTFTPSRSRYD